MKTVVLAGQEDRQMEGGWGGFYCKYFHLLWLCLAEEMFSVVLADLNSNYCVTRASDSAERHWGMDQGNRAVVLHLEELLGSLLGFWPGRRVSCGSNKDQRLQLHRVLLFPWWLG